MPPLSYAPRRGRRHTLTLALAVALPAARAGAQAVQPASAPRGVQTLEPRLREIFTLWDTDGDGVVRGREYDRMGGGPPHYDLDKDGVLTAEEYGRYHAPPTRATTPAPARPGAPSAATPTPSAIAPQFGRYICTGYGMNAGGGRGFVYKGEFVLLAGGRYRANNTTGGASLAGGRLRFAGGAYDGVAGEVGDSGGKPQIVLTWPAVRGARASTQYCSPAS